MNKEPQTTKSSDFELALSSLINKHSEENGSDTPDYILANYLQRCLDAYNATVKARDKWFQVDMWTEDKRSANFHEFK